MLAGVFCLRLNCLLYPARQPPQVAHLGPYIRAQPASFSLQPGASSSVMLRYQPRALGKHDQHVAFEVLAPAAAGAALVGQQQVVPVGGCGVDVLACCEVVGSQRTGRLPGGPTATPADFAHDT